MKITTVRGHCGDGEECVQVCRTDEHPDQLFVIGKRVTDPAVLQAFASRIAPDEILLGAIPNHLLPEV